eukprot:gene42165-56549_t
MARRPRLAPLVFCVCCTAPPFPVPCKGSTARTGLAAAGLDAEAQQRVFRSVVSAAKNVDSELRDNALRIASEIVNISGAPVAAHAPREHGAAADARPSWASAAVADGAHDLRPSAPLGIAMYCDGGSYVGDSGVFFRSITRTRAYCKRHGFGFHWWRTPRTDHPLVTERPVPRRHRPVARSVRGTLVPYWINFGAYALRRG